MPSAPQSFDVLRERLVDSWVGEHAIDDSRVRAAMRRVPREAFVLEDQQERAYDDAPLPIGEGQTISQPFMVARMAQALALGGAEKVLEVGTGSGYAAAILSLLSREVHTVEREASLAAAAEKRLRELGYANVQVHHGDGTRGWLPEQPCDAIVVAAAGPRVPPQLLEQLAMGGRLVLPVGEREEQTLIRLRRTTSGVERDELEVVRFVPLVEGVLDSGTDRPEDALQAPPKR